eukprot:2700047-Amphidinium_carterae.6
MEKSRVGCHPHIHHVSHKEPVKVGMESYSVISDFSNYKSQSCMTSTQPNHYRASSVPMEGQACRFHSQLLSDWPGWSDSTLKNLESEVEKAPQRLQLQQSMPSRLQGTPQQAITSDSPLIAWLSQGVSEG